MKLYRHQRDALRMSDGLDRVAYYHDMGLGKTFTGGEKLRQLNSKINLIICQKSKVQDWVDHFDNYFDNIAVLDLTKKKQYYAFIDYAEISTYAQVIGVINYELVWRRREIADLHGFTLLLDESSLIQNEQAKRSKFIMKLRYKNLILLSGTPTSGKYERLWSQLHMLGWNISKELYWRQYVDVETTMVQGFPVKVVKGYKNVDRLKSKMREYGCFFLKTSEVFDLPDQMIYEVDIRASAAYKRFRRDRIVKVDDVELIGDTILTKLLYERQLCGQYSQDKLNAFRDLAESTNDRLIVFYNFTCEMERMLDLISDMERPISIVNGDHKDLNAYEKYDDSITFVQYQAGAMGLNLQKANKIIYFTPTLSSELFEQSKKRIHRIGQDRPCFYYKLVVTGSIEEKIYRVLDMRKDYTDELFREEERY